MEGVLSSGSRDSCHGNKQTTVENSIRLTFHYVDKGTMKAE